MAVAAKSPKTDRWYDTRNLWLFENRPVMWLALNKHRTHRDRPISLQDRPYLRQLYMSTNPYVVVKKSTQCGVSEWLTVCTFAKAISGRAVFYVLPTWQLIGRFVKNRVDRSIQFTEFYRSLHQLQLLRQQKYGYSRPSESMSLKHFGPGVIAYAGSNTTAPFTEFPADDVIIDELDECDQGNLHMAWERMSASEDRRQLKVGNPTIEGYGIDAEYTDSKQYEWHIECECGELVHPDWFKHVVRRIDDQTYVIRDQRWKPEMARDVHMVCHHCERPLPRMGAGKWLARFPQKDHAGYHISKLFSTTVTVRELVERFEKGLVNDDALQRFYNGDLGQAYTAPGAKISEADLRACIDPAWRLPHAVDEGSCVAGVDVGAVLHVHVSRIERTGQLRSVYIGTAQGFDDLRELTQRYNVRAGVVDALPETRLARRIVAGLRGWFQCFYSDTARSDGVDLRKRIIAVDRTQSLDAVKESIATQAQILPGNAATIPEFFEHVTASTRRFKYNELHPNRSRYVWSESSPDHHFHALNYMWLARKILTMISR